MHMLKKLPVAVLSAILLAGCTADDPQVIECHDSTAADTTAEHFADTTVEFAETTADTAAAPAKEESQFFTVLDNPGKLRFELYSMRSGNMRYYPYNDHLSFYLVYEQDEKGYYFIRLEKHTAEEDGMKMQMLELYERCDPFQLPDNFAWTDTGFVLTGRDTVANVTVSDTQFGVSLTPPEATYSSFARSPSGKYTAYMQRVKTPDGFDTDAGSIYLRDAAGNVTKIFTNRGIFDENGVYHSEKDQPGADVLTAEVIGFMDETHLLCTLFAGGFPGGGAIYDTETGTWSEHRGDWQILALHDGYAYMIEVTPHMRTVGLWRMDKSGAAVCLTEKMDAVEAVVGTALGQCGIRFTGGIWIISPFAQPDTDIQYLFSADLQTHLATLEYDVLPDRFRYFHHETVVGNTLLIGFDGEQLNDDPMPPPSERIVPMFDYSEEELVVRQNKGGLNITAVHTGTEQHRDFVYDDRYMLIVCYNHARDKDGNDIWDKPADMRLKLLDITQGAFVDDIAFPMNDYPHGCIWLDGAGCQIYNRGEVWQVTVTDWKLSAEPLPIDGIRIPMLEKNGRYFYSPDGRYRAVDAGDSEEADSGIILRDAEGEFHRICSDVHEPNAQTFRRHKVLGFLDNTHLAYSIGGWEGAVGWGIYDIETKQHVTGRETAVGLHDGYLYAYDSDDYLPHTLKKIAPDGTVTVLAEKSDAPETLFPGKPNWYYRMYAMRNGLWIIMAYEDLTGGEIHYSNTHTYIYSADTETLLAEAVIGYKTDSGGDFWYTDGKTLTIVKT